MSTTKEDTVQAQKSHYTRRVRKAKSFVGHRVLVQFRVRKRPKALPAHIDWPEFENLLISVRNNNGTVCTGRIDDFPIFGQGRCGSVVSFLPEEVIGICS